VPVEASLHFFVQPACKPGSVRFGFLRENFKPLPSFILSQHCWYDPTTYPPATDEQSSKPVYMVFQPIRRTAPDVTAGTGELLPHLFTLSPARMPGWSFSVTLLYPHGYLPVRKHGALCCPDFPSRVTGTMGQPAAMQR
jgi:hypothetical protein